MAGLVGYESSDEETDEIVSQPVQESSEPIVHVPAEPTTGPDVKPPRGPAHAAPPSAEQSGMIGPVLHPAEESNPSFPPLEDAPMEDEAPALPPGSPYSANRALLRNLTLPSVPNMDIPPSPPGSPPPGTNKKFEQFLELKKKGVHFNSKIAQSSALKNPGLMDKLLNFAEVDQKGQYSTTLAPDLWEPNVFPKAAYKEQLRQSQTEVGKAKARAKGGPVEFVGASGPSSRDATPSVQPPAASTGKRKTRFDT
ncbi:uncharacterized protein JN550_012980 [Neoarthrinium moseri]|uniref:uncharacterized protein n=1 Tax=Neoarthrinium moseri TaxID=1658444 RepID=UPI001FDDCBB8|nr:uncharacterized protein JN550_012980 [Neoarthrinium moseri]KAI1857840.1 hypothetical protein JN550_012980 [Neoarthrinium moseri]